MTLRAVDCQAPLSMGFFRQEYWSGLLHPPLGDLPNPGMESVSLTSPAMAGGFFTTSITWEAHVYVYVCVCVCVCVYSFCAIFGIEVHIVLYFSLCIARFVMSIWVNF